ncbi:MAG: hypothetical protein OEQ74_03345, partial [Gammaproteobacteria bacterium]|nr:hypothetical protein [Gammaproteobacteria bacterium]
TAMIGDKPLPPELREAGKSTAVGAAFGGAVGAGLPALASGVRAVVRNVPFVVRPFTRQARINEAGRKQIAASLERDVDIFVDELVGDRPPTPKDFDVIRKQLQKEMDTYGLTVGDLGPNLRGLVEDIAQTGTVQGNRMRRFLSTRATGVMVDGVNQGGQYSRVVPKLSKLLGMGGADSQFHRNLIQMQVAAKKVAKADFDRAYFNADGTTRRVVMTPEMHRILEKTPLGREARELAEVIAENNGRKLPAYGGVGGKEPTEVMHVLMQGMDDVVSKKWRVERGAVARSYDDQFKKFVADVRRQNPELAKAQSRWATEKKAEEALQAGRSIFKKDFDLVETQLAKMQENELTHFRIGVLREIEKRIGSKRDAIDLTKDLLDKREIREALRIAFGDEAKFRKVMRLLEAEAKMHETYHAAVGNSKTALRLSRATIDMGEKLATLAGYGSTLGMGSGVPPSFGGFLARKLYQAIGGPQRASRTVNDILQNQNTILQGGSLNAATQPQTTLAGLLNTGAPAPASALAGALAATGTGQPQ